MPVVELILCLHMQADHDEIENQKAHTHEQTSMRHYEFGIV